MQFPSLHLLNLCLFLLGCALALNSCGTRLLKHSVSTHAPMIMADWSDSNTYAIDETSGTKINNLGIARGYGNPFQGEHFWGAGASFIRRLEEIPDKRVVNNMTMGGFASGGIRRGRLSASLSASATEDEYMISAAVVFNLGMGVKTFFKRY